MNNDKIKALLERMEDFEKRDMYLINFKKVIAKSLTTQDEHISKLFKGYVALGIAEPDNGEMVVANPITSEMFFSSWKQLEKEYEDKLKQINEPINNDKSRDIFEDFIVKMFDLTATRWESIVAYMQIWRDRRFESRKKSIGLKEAYTSSEKSIVDIGNFNSEEKFKEFTEILDYQEKHLKSEEGLMIQTQEMYKLRQKLIEKAVQVFSI